jgi:hypothetical protein
MSVRTPVRWSCPQCHRANESEIWESINFQIDPIMAEVMDGSFQMTTCSGCGFGVSLNGPVLCHCMERRYMIWYWPHGDFAGQAIPKNPLIVEYKLRWVRHLADLQEKIFLFTLGFDDRPVECFKAYMERRDRQARIPVGSHVVVARFVPHATAAQYESVVLRCTTPEGAVVEVAYPFQKLLNVINNLSRSVDQRDRLHPMPQWRQVDMIYGRWVCFNDPA